MNIKNNNKLFICKLKKFKRLFIISCDRELLISRNELIMGRIIAKFKISAHEATKLNNIKTANLVF